MSKLTLRQQRFVEEYPKDLNGMAAAVRAGYSAHTADRIAARLLNHCPHVKAAIEKKLGERAKRCEIKSDDVLRELDHVTHSDIAELVDEKTGCLKSVHAIPENARRAIASIEVEELFEKDVEGRQVLKGYLRKVKFWDKNRAAELLAKHKGLLIERLEVKHQLDVRQVHDSLLGKLNARLNALAATTTPTLPVAQA
jgi:phage terminase small subunit